MCDCGGTKSWVEHVQAETWTELDQAARNDWEKQALAAAKSEDERIGANGKIIATCEKLFNEVSVVEEFIGRNLRPKEIECIAQWQVEHMMMTHQPEKMIDTVKRYSEWWAKAIKDQFAEVAKLHAKDPNFPSDVKH
jgi:hypothetical protein